MKRFLRAGMAAALCLSVLSSCGVPVMNLPHTEAYLAEEARTYASYDLAEDAGITFHDLVIEAEDTPIVLPETEAVSVPSYPNREETDSQSFLMRVFEPMDVYAEPDADEPVMTLDIGERILLTEPEDGEWAKVESEDGKLLGWAKDGFLRAVGSDCEFYAELPVEYGFCKTNQETYVSAYSHLVDVRKYFNTIETVDPDLTKLDLDGVDFVISMKLSTSETSIGEPFYHRNLCLLQYDVLPMMREAVEKFRADGYTIVIYDAYRPTSVQQRWFDVVRVHKWVADPSIGMGGIHDRGTAVDISLIDRNGNLLEMPTPMHTFTEASARSSTIMTWTARQNMDYMKDVMVSCGFTYINSEWWHFQDVNTVYYLPTDHPLDTVPLVASEK